MYLSHNFKFIYFGPSKNASTAIIALLVKEFKAEGVSPPIHENPQSWALGPHHSCFLPSEFKEYFKFTSVRNPFDRAISWYHFLPERDATKFVAQMTFDEFIKEMCFGEIQNNWRLDCWKYSQKQLIFDQPIRENCVPVEIDRYIKVEKINKELNSLPFVNKKLILGNENRSISIKQKYFPKKLVSLFVERFEEDFDMFNYSKNLKYLL